MKRSEMLELVSELINQAEIQTAWDSVSLADTIIAEIELCGMLPPYSKQPNYGCECGCKGQNERGHKWDSE